MSWSPGRNVRYVRMRQEVVRLDGGVCLCSCKERVITFIKKKIVGSEWESDWT